MWIKFYLSKNLILIEFSKKLCALFVVRKFLLQNVTLGKTTGVSLIVLTVVMLL